MTKADVYAKHNMARISPKKMGIVMDVVRKMPLTQAKVTLSFDKSKAARMLLKGLKSAQSNATNNNNFKAENLYISELFVNGAKMYKLGRPGSKGRFSPILKRNSHITVGLKNIEVKKENVKK